MLRKNGAEPGDFAWGEMFLAARGMIIYKDTNPNSWWYFKDGKLGGIKPVAAAATTNGTTANSLYDEKRFPYSTLSLANYPINAAGALEIPASIGGVAVTEILPNAFGSYAGDNRGLGLTRKYRAIKTLTFAEPSTVTTIGSCAFWDANSLTSLTLPTSLKTIDSYAVYYATKLETLNIPPSVTTVGAFAFGAFHSLGTVTFEGDTTTSQIATIGNDAFVSDAVLYDIYLTGKNVGEVSGAPWSAVNATIHYADEEKPAPGVYTSGPWVYNEDTQTIMGYKHDIGGYNSDGKPEHASGIDLVVPATLSRPLVSWETGYPGTKATNILALSNTVFSALKVKIGVSTKAFNSVVFEEGIQRISGFDQMSLVDAPVTIPASATQIADLTFRSSSMGSVTFVGATDGTSKLTSIGASAFRNSKITSLVLPDGLVTIGDMAFMSAGTISLQGEIIIPSTVKSIGGQSFGGHKVNTAAAGDPANGITQFTVKMSRADAPAALFNTKPWGVTPSTVPVVFNASTTGLSAGTSFAKIVPSSPAGAEGDTANLSYRANLPLGDFVNNVVITGPSGYVSQAFPQPGASNADASGNLNYLTRTLENSFLVDRNGTYTLTLKSKNGETISTTHDVTAFGSVDIISEGTVVINIANSNDVFGDGSNVRLNAVTDSNLIALAKASALDKDSGNAATLSVSAADVNAVKALTSDGESTTITLNASYTSRFNGNNSATKTVKFTLSGKIYRTFNIRTGDIGLGKFTDGDTDTSKVVEYSSTSSTVTEANIPTPVVDSTNPRKDDIVFVGWYRIPNVAIGSTHEDFKTAVIGGAVGTQSITYEARFIIDHDNDGKDDRSQGVTTFNYASAKGSVKYNSAVPVVGTGGVSAVSADSFSVKADTPSNLKAVDVTVSSDNYQFVGWRKGTAEPIYATGIAADTVPFVADTVAYPETYEAVFNNAIKFVWDTGYADGTSAGTVGSTNTSIIYVPEGGAIEDLGSGSVAPTPLAKTGYQFDGWALSKDAGGNGTGTTESASAVTQASQIAPNTYYAKFSDVAAYTVQYNAGIGGTLGAKTSKLVKWYEVSLLPTAAGDIPTRAGYTLAGWKVQGSDASVTDATAYSALYGANKTSTAAITLVAQWTPDYSVNTYWFNVTYATTGSTFGYAPVDSTEYEKAVSDLVTVKDNPAIGGLAKVGYTFAGWSTSAAANRAVDYVAGNTFKITKDTTLYPVWTPDYSVNTYWFNVTYATTDRTSGSAPADATEYELGVTDTVTVKDNPSAGGLARLGYTFAGWSTSAAANRAVDYVAGNTFTITKDTTLYPVWTANYTETTYWKTVEYSGNGATLGTAPAALAYAPVNSDVTVLSNVGSFARAGYTFAGWNTEADGKGTAYVASGSATFTITANTTLYAQWAFDPSAVSVWAVVSFNANGGNIATVPASILYNLTEGKLADGQVFPALTPTRAGYTYANWNTSGAGTGAIVNSEAALKLAAISGNTTLFAIWTANGNTAYKVEHYLVDASGTANLTATDNLTATTDSTASAAVRTFANHTLNSAYASTVSSGNVAGDGSLVLRLYYPINRHTVSYTITGAFPAGGPAAPAPSTGVAYGTPVTVAGPLSFAGYTFSGWSSAQVSGASFSMPDTDVVFSGYFTLIPVVTPPAPTTPTPDTPVTPAPVAPVTTGPTTTTTVPSLVTTPYVYNVSDSDREQIAAQTGNPLVDIASGNVPLGHIGVAGAWAVSNLLLMFLGILQALLLVVNYIKRKQDNAWADETSPVNLRTPIWIVAIAFAVMQIGLFLPIEDISQPTVWFNQWTPLFGGLFAVSVIASVVWMRLSAKAAVSFQL